MSIRLRSTYHLLMITNNPISHQKESGQLNAIIFAVTQCTFRGFSFCWCSFNDFCRRISVNDLPTLNIFSNSAFVWTNHLNTKYFVTKLCQQQTKTNCTAWTVSTENCATDESTAWTRVRYLLFVCWFWYTMNNVRREKQVSWRRLESQSTQTPPRQRWSQVN